MSAQHNLKDLLANIGMTRPTRRDCSVGCGFNPVGATAKVFPPRNRLQWNSARPSADRATAIAMLLGAAEEFREQIKQGLAGDVAALN